VCARARACVRMCRIIRRDNALKLLKYSNEFSTVSVLDERTLCRRLRKISLFSVYRVYSVGIHNIFMLVCKIKLVFTMECDLVYEDLEGSCPFQNMYAKYEYVHTDQLSKTVSRAII
jgi:hypothetical protein